MARDFDRHGDSTDPLIESHSNVSPELTRREGSRSESRVAMFTK